MPRRTYNLREHTISARSLAMMKAVTLRSARTMACLPIHRRARRCFLPARHAVSHFSGTTAAASGETRCPHCCITFATPAELARHAAHHCFPDDPTAVLRRFPEGVEALDTVSQEKVVVLGAADNKKRAHAFVSTRCVRRGLVADLPISRLQLLPRQYVTRAALRFCSGLPSYRTEPLVAVPTAAVGEVARAIADGPARYLDCRAEQELAGGVVPGSTNIPFPHDGGKELVSPSEFLVDVELEGFERDQPIFVGCRTGARSALAAEVLIGAGFTDVRNVEGGIRAWVASGLPIEPFAG